VKWRHICRDSESLVALYARLGDMPHPFTVTIEPGEHKGRTISQNGLFHAWMGQIAKVTVDEPAEIKAACHIEWGIPILRADDAAYSDFIKAALGGRTRAEVVEILVKGYVPCSSLMTKAQLSRYMDAVWRAYSPHVQLMDPQELKWREYL